MIIVRVVVVDWCFVGVSQMILFQVIVVGGDVVWWMMLILVFWGVELDGGLMVVDVGWLVQLVRRVMDEQVVMIWLSRVWFVDVYVYMECVWIWNLIHIDFFVVFAVGFLVLILHGMVTLVRVVLICIEMVGVLFVDVTCIVGLFGAMVVFDMMIQIWLLEYVEGVLYFDVINYEG